MIHIFLGTKAQLIKMAPIMLELQRREIPYNFVFSGQHKATIKDITTEFGVKEPDYILYNGPDITGILQMLFWSVRIFSHALRNRRKVWKNDQSGVVLNHGDTFSTLAGSILAKICGLKSAHIESGLRSFNLFNPFPEEAIRRLTFCLSDIYFAPGQWAVDNLSQHKGIKVNTKENTLFDALRESQIKIDKIKVETPPDIFGVVSIHRFENIFSQNRLSSIIDTLLKIASKHKLLFILHKPTKKKLTEFNLFQKLEDCPNIELRPRYSYFSFIKLVKSAEFVITDGGSNQEECHYLGKPCIIMRNATERNEGLGINALLSKYNSDDIMSFLKNLSEYQHPPLELSEHPSSIIVNKLITLQSIK